MASLKAFGIDLLASIAPTTVICDSRLSTTTLQAPALPPKNKKKIIKIKKRTEKPEDRRGMIDPWTSKENRKNVNRSFEKSKINRSSNKINVLSEDPLSTGEIDLIYKLLLLVNQN